MGRAGRGVRKRLIGQLRAMVQDSWRLIALLLIGYAGLAIVALSLFDGAMEPFVQGSLFVGLLWFLTELSRVSSTEGQRFGGVAETWTSRKLKRLSSRSRVIDHVMFERHDVDHVLITEGGVFAVETKYGGYPWKPDSDRFAAARNQAIANARDIRLLLRSKGIVTTVRPTLVVWGPAGRGLKGGEVDGVMLIIGREPRSWRQLAEVRPTTDQVDVHAACRAVRAFVVMRDRASPERRVLRRSHVA